MRVAVCVKQVPETKAVKMDEATGTIVRKGVQAIINPLDLHALEAALALKEKLGAEIMAFSLGPPQAEEALREAMAMGVDQAALVSDKAFAGSDTWATSLALAAAIKQAGPFDLILCGERATDGDTGQVGPELAAALGLPVATYADRVEKVEADVCHLSRLVEDGRELWAMKLPGVVTVVKDIGCPRLPTLRGKLRAKAATIPTLSAAALGLDPAQLGLAGSPTRVVKIFRPKVARQCQKHSASDEPQLAAAAAAFMGFLAEKGVEL